jgi:hypothetical protein
MPKLTCPCGYVHNLSPIPDEGWRTIRDKDYDPLIEVLLRREEISKAHGGDVLSQDCPDGMEFRQLSKIAATAWGWLYECPQCGRVLWQREGEDRFRIFMPER